MKELRVSDFGVRKKSHQRSMREMDLNKSHGNFIRTGEIAQSETACGLQLKVRALKPSEKCLGNLALQWMACDEEIVARDICQGVEEGGV